MHDFYIYGMLVIWSLFNFVDIYKSNTDYKHISQMFEIIVYIQQSVCFSFFSNSGTTCCIHCSSETKVPVILFNESWVFEKGKVWVFYIWATSQSG